MSLSISSDPLHKSDSDVKQGLSKSQIKKQKKREKWASKKVELRKQERVKRKLKRKAQAEERAKGGDNAPAPYRRPTLMADSTNKFRIVIDMNFGDYMTDLEISKAVQQVGRIYAINRHSENPCQLYISSVSGKILERFNITNTGYKNWDVNVSELDYLSLFQSSSKDNQNFVYLSADANDTLPEVNTLLKDETKIYVIGGLVDHNRHKNLCQTLATQRNVPTARLPIKENIKLCQRPILSTVNVFELMLQVLGSHKQWPEALQTTIPQRKIAQETKPKRLLPNNEESIETK